MKAIMRVIRLLEYMSLAGDGVSISQASNDLGFSVSSLHRLLESLENEKWVRKDGRSRYHLTLRIASVAAGVLDKLDIRKVASEYIEQLSIEVKETVHLAIFEGGEVVYVDKINGPRGMRMASRIGDRAPAYSTALGKVFLASMPENEALKIIGENRIEKRTPNTITDTVDLINELRKVSAQGYAIDNEENEAGIRCVAVPIKDFTGKTKAALSISGSILTINENSVEFCVEQVKGISQQISSVLGYETPAELKDTTSDQE